MAEREEQQHYADIQALFNFPLSDLLPLTPPDQTVNPAEDSCHQTALPSADSCNQTTTPAQDSSETNVPLSRPVVPFSGQNFVREKSVIVENTQQWHRQHLVTESFAVCGVCSDRAGKHAYYGGVVCGSCRAFFRRSVQSKYYSIFKCKMSKNCEIKPETRKKCQFCR